MANFIISIGLIDKKIYFPLIYIVVYIGIHIFWSFQDSNKVFFYLEGFGESLALTSIFIISKTFKYQNRDYNIKDKSKSKYLRDHFILFLIDLLVRVAMFLQDFPIFNKKEKPKELYVTNGLEIIFITLATYFLLKYKYYIHHFISIALFSILSIIIDIILNNYDNPNKATIIVSIFYVISESLFYSYLKYLVEKKYYFPLDILYKLGFFRFLFYLIVFIIEVIIHKVKDNNEIIFQFYYVYIEFNVWYMIIDFLIGFLLLGLFTGIIELIIINELTPNYVIIAYELSIIPSTIIGIEGFKRWIILVISIFQIISILFYLEIFELNFCSLNKNTKKNILEREFNQLDNAQDIEIEIQGYDISEIMSKQEEEEN